MYKLDRPPEEFQESSMITGISGTARKLSATNLLTSR
jgi:hypothetical protein